MTTSGSAPVVLLVVPPGTVRPEPLAAAVRAVHPDWVVTAVWAGDPQLRPTLDGDVSWHSRVERGTAVLLTQADERVDWWFASRAVSRLLDDGAPAVVVLRVGVAAVLGSLDDFVAPALSAGGVGSVVELVAGQLPDDERWPQEEHLLANGSVSAAVAVFGAAAGPAVRWITDQMADRSGRDIPVGRVFERAATLFGLHRLRGDELLGSAFGWEVDEPSVLDLTGFSASSPWSLRADLACELRVEVATRSARRSAVERALPQIAGARAPVCLPGGWSIDEVVRAAVCSADAGGTTPDPWSSTLAFRSWIAPLFWTALHARRADLSASFPDPFGHDGDRFALWRRRAAIDDGASLVAPPEIADVQRWQRTARRVDGVDLVGYHRHESSLGDVARRISAALGAANITHGDLANLRTGSPT